MRWFITLASIFVTLLLISAAAAAGDWAKGSVVAENSESPDHKFGLVVPVESAITDEGSEDADEGSEASDDANYLANLETHALLGKIAGANYVENQKRSYLHVIWSADSKTCVVNQEGYGFVTISLLQLKGTGFEQTDLRRHIEKALAAAAGDEGTGNAWFRFAPNNKLLVRALYYTGNPKGMIVGDLDGREERKIARFAGTFDLSSKKWSASEARKTNQWDALYRIYDEPDPSEDKTPQRLDQDMNDVYQGLRSVLPPARFAKVHQEQVAWLKERDAAKSVEEKSKLTEERTKTLRAVVWSQ